jgi:uncharacterized protein YxeA
MNAKSILLGATIVAILIAGYFLLFKKKEVAEKNPGYVKIDNPPVIPSDNPYKGYYGSI